MLTMMLLEKNLLPDFLVRQGIRGLLRERLQEIGAGDEKERAQRREQLVRRLRESPIAVCTDEANEQHYEVPTAFFEEVLGKHLKYSCGWWDQGVRDLDEAEAAMLMKTMQGADLHDGQRVLELGCGWGSLTLAMAARFPGSSITAVSNSATQRTFIEARAAARGLGNVRVLTCDVNELELDRRFDRVVSVEMFEHMRNYAKLRAKIDRFLVPGGKLFVHIFVHRDTPYLFEVRDESDWMAKYFFSGGIMPSDDLLYEFFGDWQCEAHCRINGRHYAKTAEAWLANMDAGRARILPILDAVYGREARTRWWVYWRVFFMACAELWAHEEGRTWFVSHYRWRKPA